MSRTGGCGVVVDEDRLRLHSEASKMMSDGDTNERRRSSHRGWRHGAGAEKMRPVMAENCLFRFGER
jgi:hypothetical protein